jgi:hypothetical protein
MVLYLHVAHAKFIWFHPYVNNQIRGTRARFYGSDMRFLSYSKPAPDKITSSLGASAWYIRHC